LSGQISTNRRTLGNSRRKLAESENPVIELSTEIVSDKVLTVEFADGGGIISYVKDDGKFIHTLNTKEGFGRKLDQLKGGMKDK
jgi:hypothetical protein